MKIIATSRNLKEQDPREQSENVNRYMAELLDEALKSGRFDLSTKQGLQQYVAFLHGGLKSLTVIGNKEISVKSSHFLCKKGRRKKSL